MSSAKGKPCSICEHEDRDAINAALLSGKNGNAVARALGLSVPSTYRHLKAGHHLPTTGPDATQAPVVPQEGQSPAPLTPALDPERTAALREAKRLRREAWANVQQARKEGDIKSVNGAITSAAKAQEHLAELRGVIGRGTNINLSNNVLAVTAMESLSRAEAMTTGEVLEMAEGELAAHAAAGDAHALAAIGRLARLLPQAQVVEPQG